MTYNYAVFMHGNSSNYCMESKNLIVATLVIISCVEFAAGPAGKKSRKVCNTWNIFKFQLSLPNRAGSKSLAHVCLLHHSLFDICEIPTLDSCVATTCLDKILTAYIILVFCPTPLYWFRAC
uniref:Uncharacterized protein n=1 Tax=Rhizophora mucronata TaxID=61149 RepID=A0A2P2IH16_RHIMU